MMEVIVELKGKGKIEEYNTYDTIFSVETATYTTLSDCWGQKQ